MNIGVGTDIVAVERIAALIRDRGDQFLHRWFSSEEINYCESKAQPALHYAARLAAKEAVAKSLQSPWNGPLPWRDIEITVDAGGVPRARLGGEALDIANRLGAGGIQITLSHCQDYATATAVYLRP